MGDLVRVYLSGPMTGKPDFNYPAFHAAAKEWRAAGHEVFNPAESFGGDKTLKFEDYMRVDIVVVARSNAVVLLRGWEKSRGAHYEVAVAQACGLDFYDADTMCQINIPHVSLSLSSVPLDEAPQSVESVAQEAHRIVHGERRDAYGHPLDDYTRTGKIWGAILGVDPIPATTCCLMMMGLKISREVNKHGRDNLTDACGYATCLDLVHAEIAARAADDATVCHG